MSLRLIRLSAELEHAMLEAQAASMRRLFDAWDKEIEASYQALLKENQKKNEQAARDGALAASIEVYLQGLLSQAQTGDDVTTSIPTGIRVASSLTSGPSSSALAALADAVSEADDLVIDPAQRSAAWAVGNGFMPHPSDLASILDRLGLDAEWSGRFAEVGDKLDRADRTFGPHPQLKAESGQQKLSALGELKGLLEGYGPDRLFRLVSDPKSLGPSGTTPSPSGPRTKTPAAAIDQATKLFS